ncbi:Serine protease inhibitor Kazal-type 2 [Tupaia chinensis]|uniref:Serine protease inhibitor Kazal-type 2 n=1 Tax=Tupaia chinensis TaxID=246437 RepID=L8Y4B9_TUPCH|nr:Serine protease inhibitor Kazal-type 2 [Tupaia chinensis]
MYPACPRILQAVCGSDMTTYANECVLCLEIRLVHVTPDGKAEETPCRTEVALPRGCRLQLARRRKHHDGDKAW